MLDFDALVLAPCAAAFGEPATYYPGPGQFMPITVIFDDKFAEVKFSDGSEIVEIKPVAWLRASTLPREPCQGELLNIRDRMYVITQPPEADTFGDLRLTLRLASDPA